MIKVISSCKNEPWCSRLNITKCEAFSILSGILTQHNIPYTIKDEEYGFMIPTDKLPEVMKEFEETVKEYV